MQDGRTEPLHHRKAIQRDGCRPGDCAGRAEVQPTSLRRRMQAIFNPMHEAKRIGRYHPGLRSAA